MATTAAMNSREVTATVMTQALAGIWMYTFAPAVTQQTF
jgi:hypothetical protein